METPGPYALLLLALAVWRICRLITDDSILERPRDWWVSHAGYWADLAQCPWCCSVHVAAVAWGGYQLWPVGTVSLAVIPALSLISAVGQTLHERLTD